MTLRAHRACAALIPFCLLLLAAGSAVADVRPENPNPQPRMIPGRVTVVFEDDVNLTAVAKGFGTVRFGLASLDKLLDDLEVEQARAVFPWHTQQPPAGSGEVDYTRYYELSFTSDTPIEQVIEVLMQNPNVKLAEPVWELPLRQTPDDPRFTNGNQWYLQTGYGAQFPDAWDIETGSDSIKYGCVDSGVNYKHPDLRGHIWVNPGEDLDSDRVVMDLDDLNGVDDDGNGITDDLIGYDFLSSSGNPVWPGEDAGSRDPDPWDFTGHGTHVAGIVSAMTNNATGVAGIAGGWHGGNRAFRGVQIMCLRVGYLGNDGIGYVNSNDCGTAFLYAAENGAHAVNASWGSQNTSTMQAGMAACSTYGVVVTHAAGNDNVDEPDFLDFNPHTNVLSVASVTSSDVKSGFSNYGFWVDVSAPGSGIWNTCAPFGAASYCNWDGTSFASPMVAGLAMLIRSAMPSLTKEQVDSLIIVNADPIDSLHDPFYWGKLGSGRINAYNTLVDLANAKFAADVTEGEVPLQVNFTDLSPAAPNPPSSWTWTFGTGDGSAMQNPTYMYTEPGVYSVSLIVDQGNPLGPGEEHLNNYIWARADTLSLDSVRKGVTDFQAVIPLYLANTSQVSEIQFAFQFTNSNGVSLDSFSTAGLRTEYFHNVVFTRQDDANQKYVILMESSHVDSSHYLTPGDGPVLNLFFRYTFGAPAGTVVVDTATVQGQSPYVRSIWGDYWPVYTSGKIVIPFCERGDADCSGEVNVADLSYLVDYLFLFGPPPDGYGGNVDGLNGINVADLNYLVEYLFLNGPPPPP